MACGLALGDEIPGEPLFRIETGGHGAPILHAGVDGAGRVLVTGSLDKTLRVWELPSGKAVRVLRPPTGPGNLGKVYAVAVSPDGRTIAAGNWSVEDVRGHVDLFDVS